MNLRLGEKVTVNDYKGQLRVFTINEKGVLEYHGVLTSACLSNATRKNSHTIAGTLESYGIGDNHAIAIPGCYVGEYFPTLGENEGVGLVGDFVDGERVTVGEYHVLSPETAGSGSLSFNPVDYFLGVESYDN
jgi:hypothetical protein